jgi:pyruvate dehydrogenase E2 component (dihydrolipoamide acetyltransferase)
LGVNLAGVEGHGPGGSITVADVEGAAARTHSAAGPMDRAVAMRNAIGAAMTRAKREIPHLYLSTTVDLVSLLAWLRRENERRPVTGRLLPAVLFVKAVARACAEIPALNGF